MLKLKWGQVVATRDGDVDLEDFSRWVTDLAKATSYIVTSSWEKTEKSSFKANVSKPKTERVLSTTRSSETKQNKCSYCDGETYEAECPRMKADDIESRWKVVTEKKLCFCCLKKNHHKTKCRSRISCGIDNCRALHHPLLHKLKVEPKNSTRNDTLPAVVNSLYTVNHKANNILLRIVPVNLYGPGGYIRVLALCDEASTVTLVDSRIVAKLGLVGEPQELYLQWTNEVTSKLQNSRCLDMNISNREANKKKFLLKKVHTVDNLALPSQTIKLESLRHHEHLKQKTTEDIAGEQPMLLIGQDNIHLIIPEQVRSGPENVPIATKCKLGWAIHGPVAANDVNFTACSFHIRENLSYEHQLDELVKQSFSLDSFGFDIRKQQMSPDEKRAVHIMKTTAKRTGRRFEIGLLWKEDNPRLPESKSVAIQRLRYVERKCLRDEKLAEEYSQKIRSYVGKEYAEKLTPEEAAIEGPTTWYLPHFPVININKKKLRLVFDAASKSFGKSLNDHLLAGPDLLQSLVAILWKFRQGKIAFCGDVREMFHQVEIKEKDRCAQRFLWRDLQLKREPDVYQMRVMTFGATCSPACAQFIKNLNAEELADDPKILKAITQKFYVDDYLESLNSLEEAIYTISEVRRILLLGGFDLVNWMTNSREIQEHLSADLLATTKSLGDGHFHKVLGMW